MADLRMEDQISIQHCRSCGVTYVDSCMCNPITVKIFSSSECVWEAECPDEDAALLAARTGWDESWSGLQGQKRSVVFMVEERVVARSERRP